MAVAPCAARRAEASCPASHVARPEPGGFSHSILLPQVAANDTAKARFIREARAQAQIEHENVISIFQVEEDRGVAFLAMPLLRGQTLQAALKLNPKPPIAEVLRITEETAKSHVKHIYSALDVSTRTEAAMRMRELDLEE